MKENIKELTRIKEFIKHTLKRMYKLEETYETNRTIKELERLEIKLEKRIQKLVRDECKEIPDYPDLLDWLSEETMKYMEKEDNLCNRICDYFTNIVDKIKRKGR